MLRNHSDKKIHKFFSMRWAAAIAIAAFSGLLTACAGGAANQSWAGLAVKGDLAFLAHNSFITAVHLDTGQKAWQYPEKADTKVLFYCDPLIDSKGDLVAGAYNGSVVKLDSATGALKWATEGDGEKIIAPIAEGPDGAYYVSSENGDLLVLDPATGAIKNRIALGKATSWGPMAINGTRIYVATIEHKVLAVNFETGTVDWSVDLGASIAGGVNLVDGKLVVGTFTNNIIALDPQTGNKLWETATDGWVWQAPVVDGETLYATDLGGELRAVTLADGAPVWSTSMGFAIQAGPAVLGDKVFAGTSKGIARAYSAANGAQVWEQTIEGGIYGSLRLAGGKLLVVVSGSKYQLAALNPENGSILWTFNETA